MSVIGRISEYLRRGKMNKIKAQVTKVLDGPYYEEKYGWWKVAVEYKDMGGVGETILRFDNKNEAELVEKGDVFQH